MEPLKDLDLAYTKDKHASVRVVFQETFRIGKHARRDEANVLVAVIALYVMELGILCVDTKVIVDTHGVPPSMPKLEQRVLETHEFPAAVRRAVALADSLCKEMKSRVVEALGAEFTPD